MKRSTVILLVVGFVCLTPIAILSLSKLGEIYRLFDPYSDEQIAGPTIVSSDWLEIAPKKPLKVERQIQMIVLDLDKSIKLERDGTLVLPDGSTVTPEVQLVGDDGKTYELNHQS